MRRGQPEMWPPKMDSETEEAELQAQPQTSCPSTHPCQAKASAGPRSFLVPPERITRGQSVPLPAWGPITLVGWPRLCCRTRLPTRESPGCCPASWRRGSLQGRSRETSSTPPPSLFPTRQLEGGSRAGPGAARRECESGTAEDLVREAPAQTGPPRPHDGGLRPWHKGPCTHGAHLREKKPKAGVGKRHPPQTGAQRPRPDNPPPSTANTAHSPRQPTRGFGTPSQPTPHTGAPPYIYTCGSH